MALAPLGTILGPIIATTLNTPAAADAWGSTITVLGGWLPLNTLVLAGTMEASGSSVIGKGAFKVLGDPAELGQKLALGAGSPPDDLAAIAKWTGVAEAIVEHLESSGQVDPTTFGAPPSGGPLTGKGKLTYANAGALGPLIVAKVGAEDAPGVAGWILFGTNLTFQLMANAEVLPSPIGLVAPAGGGPITGTGTII